MITKIRLSNWKTHEQSELEFARGTNVLIGVMGAGKSAVLDGISFALFGTFPAHNSKKLSLDNCITNKPEQRGNAIVKVFFTVNEKDYSVVREVTLGKGTTRSELREGDRLIEGPQTKRVTEEVVRVLGMDYDLFSRAVYSEQNQMDYFLQIRAGERKKKIDELLRIDRFEKARSAAGSLSGKLSSTAEGMKSQLDGITLPEIGKEKEEFESLQERKIKESQEFELAKKELDAAEHNISGMEELEKRAKTLREELAASKSKLEVYTSREDELVKEISKAEGKEAQVELDRLTQRIQEIKTKIIQLESSEIRKHKSESEKQLAILEDKIRDLERKSTERKTLVEKRDLLGKENWKEQLENARKLREELVGRQREIELTMANSEKRIASLTEAGDHCPVCDSEIAGEKRKELENNARTSVENDRREAGEIKNQLAGIDLKAIEEKSIELERIDSRMKELDVENELVENKTKFGNLSTESKQLREQAEKEEVELSQLRKDKELIVTETTGWESLVKSAESLGKTREEKVELARRITESKKQLAEAKFDESALSEARGKVKVLSEKVGKLRESVKATDELVEEKKKLLHEMEEREKEVVTLKKRVEKLAKAAEQMNVFKSALENTQLQLREHFIEAINAGLDDIWKQIYPYGDYPRLRLGVEGKGDYELQVLTLGGDWASVEGFASGGERSTAALALRIAFSMVLAPQLSWLVLDEPTHNLDARGVEQLSIAMREQLPALVDQIFIITHEDGMEAAVSGNLYRLERDKSKDEATTITLVASGKD